MTQKFVSWASQQVPESTPSSAGLLSAADKAKLDTVEEGAQPNSPTDLSYTASSRLLESSTGTDVTLPLFATNSANAGLVPGSTTGGTTNFLRADGNWGAPLGTTDLSYSASSRLLESSTGTDVTLPLFATNSTNAGLVPGSSTGGTVNFLRGDGTWAAPPAEIGLACSDETTSLTTGTAKVTFRLPYAMTLTDVRLNVNTAPTGAAIIVNVKESGVTVFSTKPQIDAGSKTSVGSGTPFVISDSSLANDAEITIDVDQIGSSVAGKGLKVWLIGRRA